MAKTPLRLVAPATVNRTVLPSRRPNRDLRTREYLTESEVERLLEAAKRNRHGHRDATMVLVAYRRGPRAAAPKGKRLRFQPVLASAFHLVSMLRRGCGHSFDGSSEPPRHKGMRWSIS